MIPDYDRDGKIDEYDYQRYATKEFFRIWINDDHDVGDVAEAGGRAMNVPTTVFIVRQANMANPARDASEIPGLLTDANKILWQRGYSLVQNGGIRYLNNREWLDHTDVLNPNDVNLNAMFNSTNSIGKAVELYFVNQLDDELFNGVRWYKGIAISKYGTSRTIAHEVLHDCGLEDIYSYEEAVEGIELNPVIGYTSTTRIAFDWGGGYYSSQLEHHDLIEKLIMCSGKLNSEPTYVMGICLPRGPVYGWKHKVQGDGSSSKVLGSSNVGQNGIQRSPGSF